MLTVDFAPCPICWHAGGVYDLLCNQPPEGSRDVWSRTHLSRFFPAAVAPETLKLYLPPHNVKGLFLKILKWESQWWRYEWAQTAPPGGHLYCQKTQVKSRSHGLSTSVKKKMSCWRSDSGFYWFNSTKYQTSTVGGVWISWLHFHWGL